MEEIKARIVKTVGLRLVEIGIEEREGDELGEDISPTSAYEYALTAEGYIHAEKSYLNEKSQSFKKIADRVLDILNGEKSSAEPISISDEGSAIPAAARFVEVSHNSPGSVEAVDRSAEHRVGKECVSTCRSWCAPF